jgi:uncharacterized Zn-finger protein
VISVTGWLLCCTHSQAKRKSEDERRALKKENKLRRAEPEEEVHCDYCDEEFSSQNALRNHVLVKHTTKLNKFSTFQFTTYDHLDTVFRKEGVLSVSHCPLIC